MRVRVRDRQKQRAGKRITLVFFSFFRELDDKKMMMTIDDDNQSVDRCEETTDAASID